MFLFPPTVSPSLQHSMVFILQVISSFFIFFFIEVIPYLSPEQFKVPRNQFCLGYIHILIVNLVGFSQMSRFVSLEFWPILRLIPPSPLFLQSSTQYLGSFMFTATQILISQSRMRSHNVMLGFLSNLDMGDILMLSQSSQAIWFCSGYMNIYSFKYILKSQPNIVTRIFFLTAFFHRKKMPYPSPWIHVIIQDSHPWFIWRMSSTPFQELSSWQILPCVFLNSNIEGH